MVCGIALAAQDPPPSSPRPQEAVTTPAQTPAASAVTVEGCLVKEQDVPGRKPDVAEKAGVMQDFVLTDTKIVKGSAPAGSAADPKSATAPTGTSGTSTMYDVKGIDGDKLKALAGKRVQIDGSFGDLSRSPAAKPGQDLANINGTTIRAVPGDCPAK
jgi:hypothetical protein